MKDYSNRELAQYYYSLLCMTTTATRLTQFQRNRETITNFENQISKYFEEYGNLKDLRIKGIGDKSKSLLELILDRGYEEALRIKVNSPDVYS